MSSNGTDRNRPRGVQPRRAVPRRILVVRLGSMGDVIHTLPAVARLKSCLPDAELSWVIEPQWVFLLKDNPYVDRVIEAPLRRWRAQPFRARTRREFRTFRGTLREQPFDLAIDFQGLLKSACVAYLSRAERVFGFDRKELREPLAASLYSDRVSARAAHVVDRNLELAAEALAAAGAGDEELGADRGDEIRFPLPAGVPDSQLPEPQLPGGGFVLTTPLAGWGSKQWPLELFSELAAMLHRETGMTLLVDCAPADCAKADGIVRRAPAGSCRLHVSSIEGLIAATRKARAVIGVDSGPLHLAAALQAPGVALFGPTDPARNGPYGSSFRVLRSPDAATSYKRRGEIDPSMRSIEPREVWAALEPMLREKPPVREPDERVRAIS